MISIHRNLKLLKYETIMYSKTSDKGIVSIKTSDEFKCIHCEYKFVKDDLVQIWRLPSKLSEIVYVKCRNCIRIDLVEPGGHIWVKDYCRIDE